jgi:hypothetical protein
MQFSDHLDRQRPAPIQDLGHASSATEVGFQISSRQPAAVHVIEQGIDRIGWLDWFVQRLVALDERREDLHPVPGSGARFGVHETLNFLQRGSMITLGLDWANLHGQSHTLVTSMRSYAWCDPTNLT